MKRFTLVSTVLALALAACTVTTPTGEVVKIGYLGPLTGDAASYGADTLNAVRMKVEEINAAGGAGGKNIELVAEDGRCNGADSASAVQKLVNVDKVIAIVGGQCSSETLAAAPIVEAAKVVIVSPVSTSPSVTYAGDYVFRVIPSDAYKGKVLASLMAKNKLTKVAILGENTDFCEGIRSTVKENLAGGSEVVFDEVVDQGVKDFRTLLGRLKDMEFDVLLVNGQSDAFNAEVAKQARALGIEQPFYGTDTSDSATLQQLAGEDVEGMIFINTSSKLGDTGIGSFAVKFREQHGEPKSNLSFATLAYDAMGIVAEGIAKGASDGTELRDYLYRLEGYKGAAGTLRFDTDGEVIGVGYAVKTFKDGKIEELELVPAQ